MKKICFGLILCMAIFVTGSQAQAKDKEPLAPYPSPEKFYEEVNSLAQAHPDTVRLEKIGASVQGRPIYVIRFGMGNKSKPQALIAAGIHAEEYIGPAVAFAEAQILADAEEPQVKSLLDKVEVDIIPCINPDGYARVYADGGKGGKIGSRKNADGVDLNRNFPLTPGAKSHHPLAGNHRPKSNYYMGTSELSEPETRAVAGLVKSGNYFLIINLHSVAGKFLYPFTTSKKVAPDQPLFVEIGKAFTAAQKNFHYAIEQSYSWYPTLGDPDEYFYMKCGIPSFTIEIGKVRSNVFDRGLATFKEFWIANPYKKYDYWVQNDAPALVPAVQKAYELTGGKPLATKFPGVNQ